MVVCGSIPATFTDEPDLRDQGTIAIHGLSEPMEPIAHVEWALGVVLLIFGILNFPLQGIEVFLLCFGAILPDIVDALVLRGRRFQLKHRAYTHNIFFLGILLFLSLAFQLILVPFFQINLIAPLFFGSVLHVAGDILSGISPVFPLRPFSDRLPLLVFTKRGSEAVGRFTKHVLGGSFTGAESLEADEMAWFWFLTIIGSWILILGLLAYFT